MVHMGEGGVEAEDLGEEEPCEVLVEVQVGEGNLGLHAKLHYVVLQVVCPEENQRLSVVMGWVGLGWKVRGQSWVKVKRRC